MLGHHVGGKPYLRNQSVPVPLLVQWPTADDDDDDDDDDGDDDDDDAGTVVARAL